MAKRSVENAVMVDEFFEMIIPLTSAVMKLGAMSTMIATGDNKGALEMNQQVSADIETVLKQMGQLVKAHGGAGPE